MNIKVLMQHSNGSTRYGFVRCVVGNIARVTWSETGSEGVDLNMTTNRSPLGAWLCIG